LAPYEDEPDFIYRIVSQDETFVHHFDPESKNRAYSRSTLAHPSEEIQEGAISREAGKLMTSFLWDSQEIIMTD
jgi:hypothetical protein